MCEVKKNSEKMYWKKLFQEKLEVHEQSLKMEIIYRAATKATN